MKPHYPKWSETTDATASQITPEKLAELADQLMTSMEPAETWTDAKNALKSKVWAKTVKMATQTKANTENI